MGNVQNLSRYLTASVLIILGGWLLGGGGLLIKGLHIQPHPLLGAIISILGLEMAALSYLFVRNLRFELPFRAALYLVLCLCAISGLTSLGLWAFLSDGSWRVGLIPFTAAQALASGSTGAVAAINLIHLSRRAGLGWKAK
jgi:hypothetical protein